MAVPPSVDLIAPTGSMFGLPVATSGPLLDMLRSHSTRGILRKTCADLAPHIVAGGVLLLVRSLDAGQQASATRVLLRHTPYNVQTCEFTLPAGMGPLGP